MSLTPEKAEIIGALFGDKNPCSESTQDTANTKDTTIHATNKESCAYRWERMRNGASISLS
jgi:hypothetical protein